MLFGDHPPGAPASRDPDAPAGGDAGDKDGKRKQAIIVIASVVGVIIAWLTYRSIRSGSTGTAASTAAATGTQLGTGTVAGTQTAGSPDNGFSSSLSQMLANLQNEIAAIPSSTVTGSTAVAQTSPSFTNALPAAGTVFTRNATTGEIDEDQPGFNKPFWLDPQQWAETLGFYQAAGQAAPAVVGFSGTDTGVNSAGQTYAQAHAPAVAPVTPPKTSPAVPT